MDCEKRDEKDALTTSVVQVRPSITLMFPITEKISCVKLPFTNDTGEYISFKVLTSRSDKYRVKPPVGDLAPGGRGEIRIFLLKGFQCEEDDKLVLRTIMLGGEEDMVSNFRHVWNSEWAGKVMEHNFKCIQEDISKIRRIYAQSTDTSKFPECPNEDTNRVFNEELDLKLMVYSSKTDFNCIKF